jgi:hypothetical protein
MELASAQVIGAGLAAIGVGAAAAELLGLMAFAVAMIILYAR